MSVESFLQSQEGKKSTFKKVAGKLLAEKEPVDTRPWIWEKEVTERDWEKIDGDLLFGHVDQDWTGTASKTAQMHILDHDYPLQLDKKSWDGMNVWKGTEKMLEKYAQDDHWYWFAEFASIIRILDPDYPLLLDQNRWNKMEEKLEELRTNKKWAEFAAQASFMHILDPDYPLQIDVDAWRGMEERLDEYKMVKKLRESKMGEYHIERIEFEERNSWASFAHLASSMRLLDSNYSPQIDKIDWNEMNKILKYVRKEREVDEWGRIFLAMASEMRILAAHKVEVTKEGIVITDKPDIPIEQLDIVIPPRPVRKKK